MKTLLSAAALAVASLCASAPASAAIVLSFTPSTSQLAISDNVEIVVTLSGLGDEILSAFDLNFVWSPGSAVNTSGSTAICGHLGASPFGCGFDVITEGDVGLQGSSVIGDDDLNANQANTLEIGRFTFQGQADGVTYFTLGQDVDFQRNFVGRNAATLNVDIGSACIAVGAGSCAVPEPASYGLVGVALLAAGLAGRTRRRTTTGAVV